MSTFVGRREPLEPKQGANLKQEVEPKADKTRAELVQEAEELGISVPKNAPKDQIQKIIDEAPVM